MSPRILVVEDERIVALDITTTLRRLGYEIAGSVATGEEAINVALASKPDLVLMDIRLAGEVDGVAASQAIVSSVDVPIVFLTAHSDNETLRRVQVSKPYNYLLKPFRTDELRCAIEVTLARHATDRELRDQERWLRTTLESIPDGIFTTDENECIKYLNPMAASMTGWNSGEAVGHRVKEIVQLLDATSRELLDLDLDLMLLSDSVVLSRYADEWPVESTASMIPNDRGEKIGRVVVLRDVSATKKALKEIERLNASLEGKVVQRTHELQHANQDLDAFSYSLAHDLRSPLRAIDGYTQSILEDYGSVISADAVERLARIRSTAQKTSRLINELLQFARVSQTEPKREKVNLSGMALEITDELQIAYGNKIRFIVQPGINVIGDETLLQAVLANLLSNACKFSCEQQQPVVEFGVDQIDGRTSFYVKDNGIGFEMQYAEEMTGMFRRLHGEKYSGDGIGLALVDRALKRIGGRMWAESTPGKGATFYFSIAKLN